MDAYSNYILQATEARLAERGREAAEYALSRAARQRRQSLWAKVRARAGRRSRPSVIPMPPRPVPVAEPETEARTA